jgi:hypothetical protein
MTQKSPRFRGMLREKCKKMNHLLQNHEVRTSIRLPGTAGLPIPHMPLLRADGPGLVSGLSLEIVGHC